jgi:hypothetical protein
VIDKRAHLFGREMILPFYFSQSLRSPSFIAVRKILLILVPSMQKPPAQDARAG